MVWNNPLTLVISSPFIASDMARSQALSNTRLNGPGITTPAIVTLIGYAILVFIVLLPIDMYAYDESSQKYIKQEYDFLQRFLLVLLLSLPFVLSIYSVNCMMVGSCVWWSWIVAIATLVWSILVLATTFANKSFLLDSVMS